MKNKFSKLAKTTLMASALTLGVVASGDLTPASWNAYAHDHDHEHDHDHDEKNEKDQKPKATKTTTATSTDSAQKPNDKAEEMKCGEGGCGQH